MLRHKDDITWKDGVSSGMVGRRKVNEVPMLSESLNLDTLDIPRDESERGSWKPHALKCLIENQHMKRETMCEGTSIIWVLSGKQY